MTIRQLYITPSLVGSNQKKIKAKQMDSGFRRDNDQKRIHP